MKTKKGYSMIVLVVAIAVILILVSSAVSVLQTSREKTAITNFIFDITTVEEEVQDFYTSTGTLPIKNFEKIDMENLDNTECEGILSQLYFYDNDNYYMIDLSQLGTMSVRDSEREYIVNEGSLKVYVKNGVEYSKFDEENTKIKYYTLTSTLVNGLEQYIQQDEEVLVVGNPLTWTKSAELRVVLPKHSLEADEGAESWEDWSFIWDFGPKTAEELAAIPEDDTVRNFKYGDILEIKSNGIYSIYVKDPDNNVTTMNVNVTKIDDISPTYKITGGDNGAEIQAIDNETGIKNIKYKTLKNYNENVLDAQQSPAEDLEGRTNIDYYLIDGVGRDLIYDLAAEIETYKVQKNTILKAIETENENYSRWENETDMELLTQEEKDSQLSSHNDMILELNNQLDALNEKYPYLNDIHGTTEASRLVLYVDDYAGNASVIGENGFYVNKNGTTQQIYLSTEILARSYNISIEGL